MKKIGITSIIILAAFLLISIPVFAAGANNITLAAMGTSGVSGMATTIVSGVTGAHPYHNVEVNIKADQKPPSDMVYVGWLVDSKDNYKLNLGAFNAGKLTFRQRMISSLSSMPYDSVAISLEPANSMSVMPTTIVAQGDLPGTMLSSTDFATMAVLPDDEPFHQKAISSIFKMTSSQFNDLRMMGCSAADIALIGSVASRCKKTPNEIASMLSDGQSWDEISASCNMTTAMVFEPYPTQAVAGSMQMYGEQGMGTVMPLMTYRHYGNGMAIITKENWRFYHTAGYTWKDVAMAGNVAAMTGESTDDILRATTIQGQTWRQIAMDRNLDYNKVKDVSAWPFGESVDMRMYQETPTMEMKMEQPSSDMNAPSESGY